MKYKLTIAFVVVAALVLSVIPMVSDDSDAYQLKEGESGVGFSVKDLSGDTLKKILPEDRQAALARYVLSNLIDDDCYLYDYSNVVITEYCEEEYYGSSISGDQQDRVNSSSVSYEITFKATRLAGTAHNLFPNEYQNAGIIKEIGVENMSQEGAYFEVTSYVQEVGYEHSKITYATNSEGGLFATHDWTKEYEKESFDSQVKYTFDSGAKSVSYKSEIGTQKSGRYDVTMDFCGVAAADVRDTTRQLINNEVDQYGKLSWNRVRVGDGEEVGYTSYDYNPDNSDTFKAYNNVWIFETDIGQEYVFYSNDDSVFSLYEGDLVDESLRSDEALKQFFEDNGTVKDTFDSVEMASRSLYQDMTLTEDLKQAGLVAVAAIGAFVVTVIVIVIVIALIKKK